MVMQSLASYAVPILGVALAAYLLGVSGFGFSLAAIPLLAFTLPPRETIPLVAVLQFLVCLPALGRDRVHVDWTLVTTLSLAALLGLVPGIVLLRLIDDRVAHFLVGVVVLICLALLSAVKPAARAPKFPTIASVGAVSGLMQGLAGMAGPPVILLMMSSGHKASVVRATLIAYFMVVSAAAFLGTIVAGLVTSRTVELALLCVPSLLIGLYAGRRTFATLPEAVYRRASLVLLFVIAGTTLLASSVELLHA